PRLWIEPNSAWVSAVFDLQSRRSQLVGRKDRDAIAPVPISSSRRHRGPFAVDAQGEMGSVAILQIAAGFLVDKVLPIDAEPLNLAASRVQILAVRTHLHRQQRIFEDCLAARSSKLHESFASRVAAPQPVQEGPIG